MRDSDPAGITQSLPGQALLPPKVQAVITTRLAQLSAQAREVAAVAAVIGRVFTFDLLVGVCGRAEDKLMQSVDELWQRRILYEQETGTYDFTHDKLREVAYAEIAGPRRRILHRRAAEVLEQLHPHDPDSVWVQIAAHFSMSAGG